MKLFFLSLIAFFFISLLSCSKKDNEPAVSYYVRFKLNDTLINHSGLNVCSLKPNTTIAGTNDFLFSSNSVKTNLTFGIHKNGSIRTGTYSSLDDPTNFVSAEFYKDQGQTAYSTHITFMSPSPFFITLHEMNEQYIKGTFTGAYLYTDDESDSVKITDGEFLVRRSK
ncbi:MAG: hypothetical protein J0L56_11785 [Chitinophagales bacterium]|nr:hypothetical protein [Chitinophagales bacterium]